MLKGLCKMYELETVYTLADLQRMHELLDLQEDLEIEAQPDPPKKSPRR